MYNVEDYIRESIDSVINQTFDFNKVQLILVDDGSMDSTKEIALEYQSKYPDNVLVLSKENGGASSARNLGLKYVKGEYVYFFDSDDIISENALTAVYNIFEKYEDIDIVTLPIVYFERIEGGHAFNFKFKQHHQIIDILEHPEYVLLHGPATVLRFSAIGNHKFPEHIINSVDALFLNEILIPKGKYAVVGWEDNAIFYYRKRFNNTSIIDNASSNPRYFTDKLINYFLFLIKLSIKEYGYVIGYVQNFVVYDLFGIAKIQELPEEWGENEIKEFWNYFYQVLSFIDEDVIINHKAMPKIYKSFFIYLKRKEFHIVTRPKKHKVFLKSGNYNIDKLHGHVLRFDYINLKKGFVSFSGTFTSSCYPESIRIEAIKKSKNKDKEIFPARHVDYGNAIKSVKRLLSIDWRHNYPFDVKIPISKDEESKISFRVIYTDNIENKSVIMNNKIKFRANAQLSDLSSYFVKNSRIFKFKDNTFYTFPYKFSNFIKNELSSMKKILFSGEESSFNSFLYRFIYLISFIFMKNKRIWLFNDRPLYADDNGKYLFEYSINQDDGIKKYFVLDKESKDFKSMKELTPNIISYVSFKHKFLYMFAEKIITSHLFKPYITPFYNENTSFYSGVITSDLYFLQHGITMGDVSKSINKRRKNLTLFLTSSDFERNSILEGDYNFDEDIVQLLGLPRYDYLHNKNTKKQILFALTWRYFLWKKSSDIGEKLLLKSEYFSRLNCLLNNKKLLSVLKEKGYNLVFKPHPELIEYIDLFDCDDESIIISKDDSYQDLFNESSLMITDYSSVFFDFAYLKKPIIYYQYADEYNYEKGYFDFKTMGFGDLIADEDALVNKIIEYIENDCVMEDKYKERVDKFFKFKDQNNCKRVYNWILQH